MPIITGFLLPAQAQGAEVTCLENLQNYYPLSPWVTHPGYSEVAWRQG